MKQICYRWFASKGMDIWSALLLESLCRVMLLDLMVTWVNVLCGQSSHIDSQHSLLYFSGWPICSQWLSCSSGNLVASLFQTARIFVVCLISTIIFLLSVNPWLVWIPSYIRSQYFLCFCKSKGLWLLFTRKMLFHNFLSILVKKWCMTDQKLQNNRMSPWQRHVVRPPYWSAPPHIAAFTYTGTARWPTGSELMELSKSMSRAFWLGQGGPVIF